MILVTIILLAAWKAHSAVHYNIKFVLQHWAFMLLYEYFCYCIYYYNDHHKYSYFSWRFFWELKSQNKLSKCVYGYLFPFTMVFSKSHLLQHYL